MFQRFSLLLIGLFATLSIAAQPEKRPLQPEDLWTLGRVSLMDVSPDDALVLYGVTHYDLGANARNTDLYTIRPDGGSTPVRLTETPQGEHSARFRPDGQKIGFLRGDQLWEMDSDGGNARQVSELPMNGFAWSPDGSRLLFIQEVSYPLPGAELREDLPKSSALIFDDLPLRHWDQWTDDKYSNIFIIGYEEGKLTGDPVNIMQEPYDSPLMPFGGMEQIAWSPDGKKIAYTCKKISGVESMTGTNSDIFLYDLATGTTENISEGMPGYDMEPVFSPNGRFLAWNSQERPGYEADRVRIFIRDLQTGEKRELTQNLDQNASHPVWAPDSDELFFISERQGTRQIWSLDLPEGKGPRTVAEGPHDYLQLIAAGRKALVAARASLSEPTELFRVGTSGDVRQLTFINKAFLEEVETGRVRERRIATTDGKSMHAWVIYPPDFDENKAYPTLLYCQGGPQSMVSQGWSYRWNLQLFAARGYIVVAPNRRGLPGFGREWNDAIAGDWGGQPMQDLLSAIDDMKKESYVDADRLGAIGASYGGFSTYWLAGNHEGRFKSFISHCGVFNLESFYGSTEELFFANQDLQGPYWQEPIPETYLKDSPHRYVQNWDTPILIVHNGRDYRVPLEQGLQAYTSARLHDVPSRFLYFPDESHLVLKPQNAVLWHRTMLDWLDQYLKP